MTFGSPVSSHFIWRIGPDHVAFISPIRIALRSGRNQCYHLEEGKGIEPSGIPWLGVQIRFTTMALPSIAQLFCFGRAGKNPCKRMVNLRIPVRWLTAMLRPALNPTPRNIHGIYIDIATLTSIHSLYFSVAAEKLLSYQDSNLDPAINSRTHYPYAIGDRAGFV